MTRESTIVHQNDTHFVTREPSGDFIVWRLGVTHAVKVGTYGRGIRNAMGRAITNADERNGKVTP